MNALVGRHTDDDENEIADYAEAHPYVGPGAVIVADPPDPQAVDGVVDDGSVPVPLKVPGEPMRYRRDIPRGATAAEMDATVLHIRDHLGSVASATDDPADLPDDVGQLTVRIVDDDPTGETVGVVGELDAEPYAPYLRDDYDPATDDDGTRFTRYSEHGRPGEPLVEYPITGEVDR